MHELLEVLLFGKGCTSPHNFIMHYDPLKKPAYRVNDHGNFLILNSKTSDFNDLTLGMIDYATDYYCSGDNNYYIFIFLIFFIPD